MSPNEDIRCSGPTLCVKTGLMCRRRVLAALSMGVAANDEEAARAALRRGDPIARTFARRRFERSLIDAALACDAARVASPPSSHVMRLAALATAKQPVGNVADVPAVEAAYAQLATPAMPKLPLVTLLTVLFTAATIAGATLYVLAALEKPSRTYVRKLPPASKDAFAKGGVPLRDAAIDKLLTEELTKLVVQGGRARDGFDTNIDKLIQSLRGPKALAAHGPSLTPAWDAMLDVFARSIEAAKGELTQRHRDELEEAVRDVTSALNTAGLGYFLEGRFKSGYPYVQAYKVEEIVLVTTNGAPRRVLSLRRLDRLNTAYAALGMHDEDRDPVLHLERIDENVASTVMPVLADAATFPLGDREWMATETGKALAAKIGAVVRAEYRAALGDRDAKPTSEIATLLIKRDDIVDEWRDHLMRKDIHFARTENLFLPPNLLDQLSDVTPNYQRNRVREIEDRLAELDAPRIHARIHDFVAASVRHHEAQHGFDYDRETELRYPQVLLDMLGSPHDSEGNERPLVRSARAELSAYLSEVANEPVTPQACVWHLGKQVFRRDRWGTGEYYAGVVVLEGLGRHLGVSDDSPRFQRGLDRERMARFALAIAIASPQKLRDAAKALWLELYGEPVTPVVDMPRASMLATR
jgi:hypothetical protein